MGLKDIANQTLQGFNAKSDKIANDNDGLPGGEYDVALNGVAFKAFDSGYECIGLDMQVLTGDYANQHEFININLDPEFVSKAGYKLYEKYPNLLTTNIKLISKLAAMCKVNLTDDDWEDMVTLSEAFNEQDATGSQFILIVDKQTSKKGKTYTNYDFDEYAEDPFQNNAQSEIPDEDIPF